MRSSFSVPLVLMLGFVVETVNIHDNMGKINDIHQSNLIDILVSSKIVNHLLDKNFPYTYLSKYFNGKLKIYHAFYDFSSVIK